MENSFNFITTVFLLGAVQGIFLALLLLKKQDNKTANTFLAFLMIAYSAFIAEASFTATDLSIQFPHLLGLAQGVVFLFGPLHYLYTRSLIYTGFKFTKKQLLHFLPFAIFYLSLLFPFYLRSGEYKITFVNNVMMYGQSPLLMFFSWAKIIQGIVYLIITLVLLKNYSRKIKECFSSIEKINLNWLWYITVMTTFLWILILFLNFLDFVGLIPSFGGAIPFFVAILIYIMGYLGLRQPEIFSGISDGKEMKKYERSGLTQEKAQTILKKLIHLMETEKPYTDNNLKLSQLAKMLTITPNYLSQVLNDTLQQNFFDFVNRYRIEESKKLILDSSQQQFTLLSIAYEVGFNSKSAFYTAFKKHTNMTPSQFKNNSL
ncbi:helix-turn-helix transcriptional regulator [bacterium]|nr:helix-turn-helix transcriptional regulator [bacterium]